jgi:zinc protease
VYGIPIVTKTLANGMEIIVLPDHSVPLVTVELAVRNGSFTEPPELNGLSHLYEHMFFKPNVASMIQQCESMMTRGPLNELGLSVCGPALKMKPQIKDIGYLSTIGQDITVSPNGTTQEEVVEYYVTVTKTATQTALRYIKDSIRFPRFDEDDFNTEKQAVIGELDRHLSEPGYYLDQAMKEKLFYKYPTRKQPGGTRETVTGATTDQMRLIQSRYYVPNNSALIVTGDVEPAEIFSQAENLFNDWARADDPFEKFPLVEHPPLAKSEGAIVSQPVQKVLVQLGWQGPSIGKDNASTYAADVFSYIISQEDSRFQRALVDTGLTAGTGFTYYTQRNVGPITAVLVTDPDKAKAAVKAFYAEVAQFDKLDYFTDQELENAKTLLEANDLFSREKPSEYAHTLSFWWSSTGIDYFRDYHKNLRAITREDINKYLKTYILGKNHVGLALISPEQQAIAKLTPADLIGGNQ